MFASQGLLSQVLSFRRGMLSGWEQSLLLSEMEDEVGVAGALSCQDGGLLGTPQFYR